MQSLRKGPFAGASASAESGSRMITDPFDDLYRAQHADPAIGCDLAYQAPGEPAPAPPVRGVLTSAQNAELLGNAAAVTRRSNAEVRKAALPRVERGGRLHTARGVFEVANVEDDDRGLIWRLGVRKVAT